MLISFVSPGRPVGQHGSVFSAVGLLIQTNKTLNRITNKNRSNFFFTMGMVNFPCSGSQCLHMRFIC